MKKEVLVLSGRIFIYYHIKQKKNPSALGKSNEQAISIGRRGTKITGEHFFEILLFPEIN